MAAEARPPGDPPVGPGADHAGRHRRRRRGPGRGGRAGGAAPAARPDRQRRRRRRPPGRGPGGRPGGGQRPGRRWSPGRRRRGPGADRRPRTGAVLAASEDLEGVGRAGHRRGRGPLGRRARRERRLPPGRRRGRHRRREGPGGRGPQRRGGRRGRPARSPAACSSASPCSSSLVAATTWVVTGRALRPVEAIRREVDAITDAELDRRVPAPGGRDEIARLAGTMNAMLDRLEAGPRPHPAVRLRRQPRAPQPDRHHPPRAGGGPGRPGGGRRGGAGRPAAGRGPPHAGPGRGSPAAGPVRRGHACAACGGPSTSTTWCWPRRPGSATWAG